MVYKLIISPRAQKEIENAIDYYSLYSKKAPQSFINFLNDAYSTLQTNPFFSIHYDKIRSLKINKFPFSIYFTINEIQKTVRVLACFHAKRNPNKRPKR